MNREKKVLSRDELYIYLHISDTQRLRFKQGKLKKVDLIVPSFQLVAMLSAELCTSILLPNPLMLFVMHFLSMQINCVSYQIKTR